MPPPNKPRRRNSLVGQWDTTTKVVNVKQKFYSSSDKYTEAQLETFTKWVNIQLRTIHVDDETAQKIPEIKAIDKDFRDGKRFMQLLHVLYENDPELPKPERGRTRHHYVANVSKVIQFLQQRLDDSGLAALQAIGPVDIVDGNVKLTLGLIWLMISKFHQMIGTFNMTEEQLAEAEANLSKENDRRESPGTWLDSLVEKSISPSTSDTLVNIQSRFAGINQLDSPLESEEYYNEPESINDFHTQESSESYYDKINDSHTQESSELYHDKQESHESFHDKQESYESLQDHQVSSDDQQIRSDIQTDQKDSSIDFQSSPTVIQQDNVKGKSPADVPTKRVLPSRLTSEQQKAKADKRLSLPPDSLWKGSLKKSLPPPRRFETLRLNSTPTSSSSGLLFWINMQLIDYASILPTTTYPIEGFTGLNDGILLATLIHHKNSEWIEDFDELIKDDANDDKEVIIKQRLTRGFSIIEDKLGVRKPKELISILVESDHKDENRLKRTELMWNSYISDIFMAMSENRKKKNTIRNSIRLNHISENNENDKLSKIQERSVPIDEKDKEKSRKKSRGCIPSFGSNRNISPMPPWAPKASVITALFEWTIGWLLNSSESDDDSDFDQDDNPRGREMKTVKIGKKRSDGTWNIQNANEWKKEGESLSENDDVPIQLLANSHQPALYMYWS
ncbi:44524_t:CDS:2 [Gigaspora margarita]|uniref:44524_t:CDS:1 n=2 Tax=Gigaspora margarita TaxID=4874 RepID=A0ABN7VUF2_GIGMA|nr:alpha-actinin, sarcomeric-like [Gigaspora margarita]CAG8797119.1 44524_t:CDS:2 [Gigaspora margarita]